MQFGNCICQEFQYICRPLTMAKWAGANQSSTLEQKTKRCITMLKIDMFFNSTKATRSYFI
jgi:hypothetical protein